jgi:hypothetical protein
MAAHTVSGGDLQPHRAAGFLRLHRTRNLGSLYRQSLVARRQQSHCFSASTVVEFEPEHFQQLAGLVCYYNSTKFHYLYVSHDETLGKHLRVMSCAPDSMQADSFTPPIAIPERQAGAPARGGRLRADALRYRVEGVTPTGNGCRSSSTPAFSPTNAWPPAKPTSPAPFVGMACQDMSGTGRPMWRISIGSSTSSARSAAKPGGLHLQPLGRGSFHGFNQFRDGDGPRQTDGEVNVVRHATDAIRLATRFARDGGEIGMKSRAGFWGEARAALLGAENDVHDGKA